MPDKPEPLSEQPSQWTVVDRLGNHHLIETKCYAVWGQNDLLVFMLFGEGGGEQPIAFFHEPVAVFAHGLILDAPLKP